jgi:CubicO group peptidase (beta-lactamase class C family)
MAKLDLRRLVVLAVLLALLGACGAPQAISPDYWPTDGWRTSTPEAQGMDSETLAELFAKIQQEDYDIDNVTIVRHGHIVADVPIYPFKPDTRHIVFSCTKSVVSALVGMAIEQGYIEGVDQTILDIFPGHTTANLDERKTAMTLEDVLTMSTGLKCEDSYLYRWRGMREMERSDNWVQFVLDLPMVAEPGSKFEYCNGASLLLSAAVQEKTGHSAFEFAKEHLFGPLGINDVTWPSNPQGITIGWSELHLQPRDMAKIGYLYLHEGQWDGQQVIPATWVQASGKKHISATLQDGYGYQWWVDDSGYYMALGYAGQFIFVIPEKDMVVVFVSDLAERDFYVPQQLLEGFIIPAAKSSSSLADNPEGVELLESHIEALANP